MIFYITLFSLIFCISSNYSPFDDTILYNIKWNGHKDELSDSFDTMNIDNSVIAVTSRQEKFLCMLPDLSETTNDSDIPYTGPNPLEHLMPLFTQSACSYRLESYWSYEICHGKYVKQYHEERDSKKVKKQEYYLGRWDTAMKNELNKRLQDIDNLKNTIKTKKIDGVDIPYLQLNYTDGTLCDLNEKPRQTNVLYMCYDHGRHDIYSIKEIYTCLYEAIIFTPLLCKHPLYKPKNSGEKSINCSPFTGTAKKPRNLIALESESFRQRHEQFLDKEQALKKVLAVFSVDKKEGQTGEPRLHVRIHPLDTLSDNPKKSTDPVKPGSVDYASDIANLLTGENCLQGKQGWWKFEFCYGKHVIQYHEETNGQKVVIELGKFSLEDHVQWLNNNPLKKYKKSASSISHFYSKGSFCAEINAARETEVKFKCIRPGQVSPSSIILYLEEPRVCRYILHVDSPIVCKLLPTVNELGMFDESKIDLKQDHDEL